MTDAELLTLLRTSPEQGCKYLIDTYSGLVLAVIRRKLGGVCTSEDMEELASDILFSIWQMRDRISPDKGTVAGLIVTITNRRCVDWYRSCAGKPERHTLDTAERFIPNVALSPEDAAMDSERRELLLSAMDQLGETDREILIRKYYCGETAAEIADDMSLRTGTVEMRLSRARQKLRDMIGGVGDV